MLSKGQKSMKCISGSLDKKMFNTLNLFSSFIYNRLKNVGLAKTFVQVTFKKVLIIQYIIIKTGFDHLRICMNQ